MPDACEAIMRLPDEVLESVVFLGCEEPDPKTRCVRPVFWGTAFFVASPVDYGATLLSLVTAKHVAEKFKQTGPFCIRANTRDGTSETIWVEDGIDVRWVYHSTDDTIDAAVLIWHPPDNISYKAIPSRMFLNPAVIQQKGIGIGDQTYATGLFTYLQGNARNMPIVRTGHIAMMPPERIPVKWNRMGIDGYLIETRSIGRLSGSPVFVQRSIKVQPTEHTGSDPLASGAIFWLGLLHGHWDIPENEIRAVATSNKWEDQINSGIAIVVPCDKILEIFEQDDVQSAAQTAIDKIYNEEDTLFLRTSPDQLRPGKEEDASRLVTRAVIDASAGAKK